MSFSVFLIDDVKHIKVLDGQMMPVCEDGHTYYVGDFSGITRQGDYFIEAGGARSRQIVIYDGAYDICQRMLLQYFTYQRCGHPLGWAGRCHLDDGYISETGERVDLSGGYHQSCDLRKSPGGVSIGVSAMLRFALDDKSEWGEILTCDEVGWACDYFTKTIQQSGAMYNTLNEPFGWQGRTFYKSAAPSSAQWNVTTSLALGYRYFEKRDTERAKKYLDAALRSWKYMTGERPYGEYSHPSKYPLGMDPDFFYDQCKRDCVADLACRIVCAAELYRATGEAQFTESMRQALPGVLSALTGYALRRDDNGGIVSGSCTYTWLMGGLFALLDAYELLGDHLSLKEHLISALDEICAFADKSVWRCVQMIYTDIELDRVCGHEGKTKREYMSGTLGSYNEYYYNKREIIEPTYACYIGTVLARGATLLGEQKYMPYAQAIADLLMGADALDSSRIRGIGYNNPAHASYGQFFPSTPFIVGAVGVGYGSFDFDTGVESEYDMPCVGLSMYLLSEIKKNNDIINNLQ